MEETWCDPKTNLEWADSKTDKPISWDELVKYVEKMNAEQFAGQNDWRCPEIRELIALIDFTKFGPAMRSEIAFKDDDAYWSATSSAKNETLAWYVDFYFGYIHYNMKSDTYHVRCVRDRGKMESKHG